MARYRVRKIPGGWFTVQKLVWVSRFFFLWRWDNSGFCFRDRQDAERYMDRAKKGLLPCQNQNERSKET